MSTVVSPTSLFKRSDILNGNLKLIQGGGCMLREVPVVSGSYAVGRMLVPSAATLCRFDDGVNGNYPVSSPPRKSRGGLMRRGCNRVFFRREKRARMTRWVFIAALRDTMMDPQAKTCASHESPGSS